MTSRRNSAISTPTERAVRASVSFPEDQYAELESIARQHRVSLAWVVREAVQTYLVSRQPPLKTPGE
jgi:metal-responsive CopG/Arc/MetJ family transcriptional regulator